MSTTTAAKTYTVNCQACKALNPGAGVDSKCGSCGEPLAAAVLQHNLDDLKRLNERVREAGAPSFNTFNGFGTTLLDYRRRDDGTWEATRWVVAAMLPVAPLAAYRIRPRRQENSHGRSQSYFDVLGRAPLSPLRVLRVYGLVLLGLAPAALGWLNSSWVNRTLGGPPAALAMLASVASGAYIIFFRVRNDSEAYKPDPARRA
jgi:bacterioferritin-associated ferredoxin